MSRVIGPSFHIVVWFIWSALLDIKRMLILERCIGISWFCFLLYSACPVFGGQQGLRVLRIEDMITTLTPLNGWSRPMRTLFRALGFAIPCEKSVDQLSSQDVHIFKLKHAWSHSIRLATILSLLLLAVGCASRHSGNRAAAEPPPWVEASLRTAVVKLAGEIGERNLYRPKALEHSATWIEQQLRTLGYEVRRQAVAVDTNVFRCAGATAYNVEAVLVGHRHPEENIIIGAHYDTKVATAGYRDSWPPLLDRPGTPGANDNASGVAALLTIARSLAAQPCAKTLRLVFFSNEEPPFFKQPSVMGSYLYAGELKAKGVRVEAMLSLEILGCYSKRRPNKKRFWYASPAGLSHDPDYVAFVSDLPSWHQSKRWAAAYARYSPLAARTLAIPVGVSRKIGWSDDWAFWRHDLRAVCVTDTGFLRCDDYHELSDTPDRLDYAPFALVVWALEQAIRQLANE